MLLGTFVQNCSKIAIADPVDYSMGKPNQNVPTMIIAKNVLKGKWNVYYGGDETSNIHYILHENYANEANKMENIRMWKPFDNDVTLWGRMFGFFDFDFYRNDEICKGKKYSKFLKYDGEGNEWYNYLNHNYWKGSYTDSILDHGCTFYLSVGDFCEGDSFSCYYLKNLCGKIYGLAFYWDEENDEDVSECKSDE